MNFPWSQAWTHLFIWFLCLMSLESTSDFGLITLIIYVDATDVLGSLKSPHRRTHFPTSQ